MADNEELDENLSIQKEINDTLKQRLGIQEDILDTMREDSNILEDHLKSILYQVSEKKQLAKVSREINRIAEKNFTNLKEELGTEKNISSLQKDRQSLIKNVASLKSLIGKISLEDKNREEELNKLIQERIESSQQLIKETNRLRKESEKIKDNFGVKTFAGLQDVAKSIPGLRKFSDTFDKAAEASRKSAVKKEQIEKFKELRKEGKKIQEALDETGLEAKDILDTSKPLVAGFKELSKESKTIFKAFVLATVSKQFKQFSEDRAALAKTFGLGKDDANNLKASLTTMANSSGEVAFNVADAVKSTQQLNTQLGTAARFTGDTLKMFSLLSDELGFSVESSAQLVKNAEARGENSEEYIKALRGEVTLLAASEGKAVNQQQIFEEIGKISAATRITLEAQGRSLVSSVYEANKLGLSLSDLEKTSDSLLGFESSIAAEMEAELLTGKQLNLEGARRAALMGDQESLAREISEQIGTSAEFGKMNVIQQQALAKAFGMSRDELAGVLEQQDLLNKLQGIDRYDIKNQDDLIKKYNEGLITQEELAKIGDEQFTQQIKSLATQQKLSNAIGKLTDKLIPVVDVFASFVDLIADGLGFIGSISDQFQGISNWVNVIAASSLFDGSLFKAMMSPLKTIKNTIKGILDSISKVGNFLGIGGSASSAGQQVASQTGQQVASQTGQQVASQTGQQVASQTGQNIASQVSTQASSQSGGAMSNFLGKMNPKSLMKKIPQLVKATLKSKILPKLLKWGPISLIVEGIFANNDIKKMINDKAPLPQLQMNIGNRAVEGISGVLGGVGGAALFGALGTSVLGPIGTVGGGILGGVLGDMMGRYISKGLQGSSMANFLGKGIIDKFYGEEMKSADYSIDDGAVISTNSNDFVIAGTSKGGNEKLADKLSGGSETISTQKVEQLLENVITAIESLNLTMNVDGVKLNTAVAMNTVKLGS